MPLVNYSGDYGVGVIPLVNYYSGDYRVSVIPNV
jgi:hypothetical protein